MSAPYSFRMGKGWEKTKDTPILEKYYSGKKKKAS
jgi:hypothetical protein